MWAKAAAPGQGAGEPGERRGRGEAGEAMSGVRQVPPLFSHGFDNHAGKGQTMVRKEAGLLKV